MGWRACTVRLSCQGITSTQAGALAYALPCWNSAGRGLNTENELFCSSWVVNITRAGTAWKFMCRATQ
jgi:hypothetical protein